MPTYEPLDVGVSIVATGSDLIAFQLQTDGTIDADFIITYGDHANVLRITFDRYTSIVRLLNEDALSTEDEATPVQGLVYQNFAYRVHGAVFAQTQSELWKYLHRPMTHYRFVTASTCMDLLSCTQPNFSVVVRGG